MNYLERRSVIPLNPASILVGEWYLRGFADAYDAHWALVPNGPEGEHYRKGYALGLAAVRREFLVAALSGSRSIPASTRSTLL